MASSTAALHLLPLIRQGWLTFGNHAGFSIAALSTLFGLWALLEVLVISTQRLGTAVNIVLHVIYLGVAAGLELGLVKSSLAIVDGGSATYRDLFSELRLGPHFLAAKLLYLLLLALGLISLVVPGLMLGARYAMFPGIMADGQRHPVEALKSSSTMVRGRTGRVFVVLFALLLFNVLGACLLGVGLLLTVPTTLFALAHLYRQIRRDSLPAPSVT